MIPYNFHYYDYFYDHMRQLRHTGAEYSSGIPSQAQPARVHAGLCREISCIQGAIPEFLRTTQIKMSTAKFAQWQYRADTQICGIHVRVEPIMDHLS